MDNKQTAALAAAVIVSGALGPMVAGARTAQEIVRWAMLGLALASGMILLVTALGLMP